MKSQEELLEEIETLKVELQRERAISDSLLFSVKTLRERARSTYFAATHLHDPWNAEKPVCRAHGLDIRLTNSLGEVTCRRCLALKGRLETEPVSPLSQRKASKKTKTGQQGSN